MKKFTTFTTGLAPSLLLSRPPPCHKSQFLISSTGSPIYGRWGLPNKNIHRTCLHYWLRFATLIDLRYITAKISHHVADAHVRTTAVCLNLQNHPINIKCKIILAKLNLAAYNIQIKPDSLYLILMNFWRCASSFALQTMTFCMLSGFFWTITFRKQYIILGWLITCVSRPLFHPSVNYPLHHCLPYRGVIPQILQHGPFFSSIKFSEVPSSKFSISRYRHTKPVPHGSIRFQARLYSFNTLFLGLCGAPQNLFPQYVILPIHHLLSGLQKLIMYNQYPTYGRVCEG